jgi:hypothetical protein
MADAGFTHAAVADIPNSATSRRGMLPALAGLAAGLAYATISVYWAAGGRWLLNTVGISLSQPGQAGHLAVLLAVWGAAAVKAVAAVLPLLAIGVWPRTANGGPRRLVRVLTWIEAAVLVGYGLVLTASGLLVQAGVIKTAAHADRLAMKWHAYLWDPWFLIWGIFVFLALWQSRPSSQDDLPGRRPGQSRVLQHRPCVPGAGTGQGQARAGAGEHLTAPWKNGGTMSTEYRRAVRCRKGLPNWRIVRYADDFAVLVSGSGHDAAALREDIAGVLAGLGLRFSEAKTRVTHMSEGFSFLGFRIQWRRKRGTAKWYVYTFIDDRPVRSLKAKIRTLTPRTSQLDTEYVLTRLNQVMHGWANYFRHAIAKNVFAMLDNFAWWRVIRMLMTRHRWRWKDVRRQYTTASGRWLPVTAGEIEMRPIAAVPVTRYRYRGSKIPGPWAAEPA